MTKEEKKNKNKKKSCAGSKGLMLTFGFITIASRAITAVSLASIALGFCSVTKESDAFKDCFEEARESGKSPAAAFRYCNGG